MNKLFRCISVIFFPFLFKRNTTALFSATFELCGMDGSLLIIITHMDMPKIRLVNQLLVNGWSESLIKKVLQLYKQGGLAQAKKEKEKK